MVGSSSYFRSDLKRAFNSYRFPLSVALFTLARLSVAFQEMVGITVEARSSFGILGFTLFYLKSNVTIFSSAICCFPFVAAFVDDKESKFSYFLYSRGHMNQYTRSKALTCFLSAMIVAFMGYLLATFVIGIYTNFSMGHLSSGGNRFSSLDKISDTCPLAYLFILITHNSMIQGIWAVFTLGLSAFVQNLYLIVALSYASRILFYYLSQFGLRVEILNATSHSGAYLAREIPLLHGAALNCLQFIITFLVIYLIFKLKCYWDWKEA